MEIPFLVKRFVLVLMIMGKDTIPHRAGEILIVLLGAMIVVYAKPLARFTTKYGNWWDRIAGNKSDEATYRKVLLIDRVMGIILILFGILETIISLLQ